MAECPLPLGALVGCFIAGFIVALTILLRPSHPPRPEGFDFERLRADQALAPTTASAPSVDDTDDLSSIRKVAQAQLAIVRSRTR